MGSNPILSANQTIRKNRLPKSNALGERFFAILRDVENSKIHNKKFKIYSICAHYATRNATRKEGFPKGKPSLFILAVFA